MTCLTVQCRLVAPETTRRELWVLMARYTQLVATVLDQLGQHPELPTWRQQGCLPAKVLADVLEQAEANFQGLPARWYTSARWQVQQTYDGWLQRQQRLQQRLQGQRTWLSVMQSDERLAQQAGLSVDELRQRAQAFLAETTLTDWFRAYATCQDPGEKSVLAYLLKHRRQVPTEPENPQRLARRRRQVEILIERLEAQLAGERPQGRDLTGQRYMAALQAAIRNGWEDPAEFARWQASLQSRPDELPFPVMYATNTDITWRRDEQGKLWVKFNGLGQYEFRVGCGQRQQHWFERFYQDQELYKQRPKELSQALFTLRSVELLWKPGQGKGAPWDANYLYLHCAVDTRLWTQAGTALVRQEKAQAVEQKVQKLASRTDLTPNQQAYLQRLQTTLARLGGEFPRPKGCLYQGRPHLVVGVGVDMHNLLAVALVDVTQDKVLKSCSLRTLLGKDYALVRRWRYQQRQFAHERKVAQQRGSYKGVGESNLAIHVERLIAKAVVHFAQQHLAGSLAVPSVGGIREAVQAAIQARAEARFPNSKELQRRYAKEYRVSAHRWSCRRLLAALRQRAAVMGLPVEEGLPDVRGSPVEQARSVALSAYYRRHRT